MVSKKCVEKIYTQFIMARLGYVNKKVQCTYWLYLVIVRPGRGGGAKTGHPAYLIKDKIIS